jgi:transcriptional regulator with XRE-family HTH domain
VVLKCPKPLRGYPLHCATVADHLRKRRLDLKLTKLEAGRRLGIGPWTYTRWERSEITIEVHYYPRIISFLGYNPLPEPASFEEAVLRERTSRGLGRLALASLIGVAETTIARAETDSAWMVKRTKCLIARALNIRLA